MPAASFQPQTIDLSASFVQLIRTALNNPKVTFDKTGLKSFDASGKITEAINADGTATFTGVVNAQGLILPAGSSSTPANQIQWQRTSDGAEVAFMTATDPGASLIIRSTPASGDTFSQADFGSTAAGGSQARIRTTANNNSGSSMQALLNSLTKLILDDAGNSDFLQLLASGLVKLAFNHGTVASVPAGGPQDIVIAEPIFTNQIFAFTAAINPTNSSSASLYPVVNFSAKGGRIRVTNSSGAAQPFDWSWIAIGN